MLVALSKRVTRLVNVLVQLFTLGLKEYLGLLQLKLLLLMKSLKTLKALKTL